MANVANWSCAYLLAPGVGSEYEIRWILYGWLQLRSGVALNFLLLLECSNKAIW